MSSEGLKSEKILVRLPDELLLVLQSLVMIDGGSLNAQFASAVNEYATRRKNDPNLPDKIAAARQRLAGNENS